MRFSCNISLRTKLKLEHVVTWAGFLAHRLSPKCHPPNVVSLTGNDFASRPLLPPLPLWGVFLIWRPDRRVRGEVKNHPKLEDKLYVQFVDREWGGKQIPQFLWQSDMKVPSYVHHGVSLHSRFFVEHFWHVPPAVGLILQLLCSPIGNWHFKKKLRMRGRPMVYNFVDVPYGSPLSTTIPPPSFSRFLLSPCGHQQCCLHRQRQRERGGHGALLAWNNTCNVTARNAFSIPNVLSKYSSFYRVV